MLSTTSVLPYPKVQFAFPRKANRWVRIVAIAVVTATTFITSTPHITYAQASGQATQSSCDGSSFMVGDLNSAIQKKFGDIPFMAGSLCSIMDKMVLVTIIVGFGILVYSSIDSHHHKKSFSAAISPFFDIIVGFILAWLLVGYYNINSQGGNTPGIVQGG